MSGAESQDKVKWEANFDSFCIFRMELDVAALDCPGVAVGVVVRQ